MARIYRQIEAEAREEGEKRARKLIADAIQRVASDHVAEVTSSVVPIPSEEMKGRIVGRNGRNIKAFEQAAGVDVIVDDTPEAVTISCFDSVRREIARRALTRLTVDGRIHPAHIEKILEEETKAIDKIINEAGEQAAFEAGIAGLHPEVLRMMGRLKFRTSYGQNQLARTRSRFQNLLVCLSPGFAGAFPRTTYDAFSAPSMNDSGVMAFTATLDTDQANMPKAVVVRQEGSKPRAVVTNLDEPPGQPGAKFEEFSAPLVTSDGSLLFGARWSGKDAGSGLLLWSPRGLQALSTAGGIAACSHGTAGAFFLWP